MRFLPWPQIDLRRARISICLHSASLSSALKETKDFVSGQSSLGLQLVYENNDLPVHPHEASLACVSLYNSIHYAH